jgi:AcrR family transcriptional regulator
MRKELDWAQRRDEILAATWRVIARDGIARATVRSIAREAGCSLGILSYYFSDKEDLLGSAMVLSHRRVRERIDRRTQGLKGLAALRVLMVEALPMDPDRLLEAQIEVSFWGRALSSPKLLDLQHREFERLCDLIKTFLHDAVALGECPAETDIDFAAHALVMLIDGLSVEAVLYPERVPPERQLALLEALLTELRGRKDLGSSEKSATEGAVAKSATDR